MNSTAAEEDDTIYWGWIFLPIFISILFYSSLVLFTWPYARPVLPIWLLLLAIFFPPLFPFVLLYLLFLVCASEPPKENVIVVLQPSRRGGVSTLVGHKTAPLTNGNRV